MIRGTSSVAASRATLLSQAPVAFSPRGTAPAGGARLDRLEAGPSAAAFAGEARNLRSGVAQGGRPQVGRGLSRIHAAPGCEPSTSPAPLVGDALRSALRAAVGIGDERISHVSESDDPVVAFVVSNREALPLEPATIRARLARALRKELRILPDASLDDVAIIKLDQERAADHLEHLSVAEADDVEPYVSMRAGFRRALDVMRANLGPEIAMFKAGPRDEDGSLDEDSGKYLYVIAGRAANGDLAGVRFGSVET